MAGVRLVVPAARVHTLILPAPAAAGQEQITKVPVSEPCVLTQVLDARCR